MKDHATKEAGVRKDQRSFPLAQDEMVMFARWEFRAFDSQFTRHAQMNAQPAILRELKQHLLSPCFRTNQLCTEQDSTERIHIIAAEDPFSRVQFDSSHVMTKPHIPSATMVFDFGELRHRCGLTPSALPWPKCP